jgi:glycosyltransferase involved in cell wall biosynthesis
VISVVVICHNYGRFLSKCVQSILLNKKKYIREILIINDSSIDNTEEVSKKLKKNNKLVKYFKCNFSSLSKSTNFGVRKSKSAWLTKIDADDFVSKNFLKDYFDELKKKKLDFIYGDIIQINELEKKEKIIKQNYNKKNIFKYPMGSGTIFSKKLWSSVGGFNEKLFYQDDFDFWLKIKKEIKFSKGYINKANYFYKKHKKNMSKNYLKKNLTKIYLLLKYLI